MQYQGSRFCRFECAAASPRRYSLTVNGCKRDSCDSSLEVHALHELSTAATLAEFAGHALSTKTCDCILAVLL